MHPWPPSMSSGRPSLGFDHFMPSVFPDWSLLLIEKISLAYSRWLTIDGSDSAAYSSVPVQYSYWGSPSYNDLFRHSNDTLAPDIGSFSTYDLLLYTQSIGLGKLSSPQGVFVHILHKKDSQYPCGHRSQLKSFSSSATTQPSFSNLTVNEVVPLNSYISCTAQTLHFFLSSKVVVCR